MARRGTSVSPPRSRGWSSAGSLGSAGSDRVRFFLSFFFFFMLYSFGFPNKNAAINVLEEAQEV